MTRVVGRGFEEGRIHSLRPVKKLRGFDSLCMANVWFRSRRLDLNTRLERGCCMQSQEADRPTCRQSVED